MTTLDTHTADTAQNLLDFQVVDHSGAEIGTVHSFWADSATGMLEFIGVKTGWLFGHNHVIPADKVEVDDSTRTVRVPYTSEKVKEALSIDAEATISDEEEAEIYRYYGLQGGTAHHGSAVEVDTHATSATTGAMGTAGLGATAAGMASSAVSDTKHGMASGHEDIEVPLTEESVQVGKRTVDAGQVRLRKIVRTEIVNQPVEIRHEDVVVERVSADQVKAGAANSNFDEEVIDVPLTREEAVVQKTAQVTGAVRVHKTSEAETQNISETVRKEDVEVLRDGKTVTEQSDIRK